jgi:hypothetical protein
LPGHHDLQYRVAVFGYEVRGGEPLLLISR